jgi:hypothetical protein
LIAKIARDTAHLRCWMRRVDATNTHPVSLFLGDDHAVSDFVQANGLKSWASKKFPLRDALHRAGHDGLLRHTLGQGGGAFNRKEIDEQANQPGP